MRLIVYGVLIPEPIIAAVIKKLKTKEKFTKREALCILKEHKLHGAINLNHPLPTTIDEVYLQAMDRILRRWRKWGWIEKYNGGNRYSIWRWTK